MSTRVFFSRGRALNAVPKIIAGLLEDASLYADAVLLETDDGRSASPTTSNWVQPCAGTGFERGALPGGSRCGQVRLDLKLLPLASSVAHTGRSWSSRLPMRSALTGSGSRAIGRSKSMSWR